MIKQVLAGAAFATAATMAVAAPASAATATQAPKAPANALQNLLAAPCAEPDHERYRLRLHRPPGTVSGLTGNGPASNLTGTVSSTTSSLTGSNNGTTG